MGASGMDTIARVQKYHPPDRSSGWPRSKQTLDATVRQSKIFPRAAGVFSLCGNAPCRDRADCPSQNCWIALKGSSECQVARSFKSAVTAQTLLKIAKGMSLESVDLRVLHDSALLELRLRIDREMSERGLTLNVGELGEKLAIEHFNKTRGLPNLIEAPRGAKNVDALSRDGDRYSIKTALKAKKTGTVYPDMRDKDKQLFEYLLIVILSDDYKPKEIYRFSWATFLEVRAWDKRMNAWYIPISKKKLSAGEQLLCNRHDCCN